jgi:translation elongation factor EF-Tu-like GTPase
MAQEIGLTAKDIGNLTLGEANAELVINRAALKALKEKLDNQYTIAELEKAIDDLATWPERRGAELHDSAKWAEAIEAWCKKAREE